MGYCEIGSPALDRRDRSSAVESDFASAHRENGGNLCLSHCPPLPAPQRLFRVRGGPSRGEWRGWGLGTDGLKDDPGRPGKKKKGEEEREKQREKTERIQDMPGQKEAKRAVAVCRQGLNAVPESRKASLRPVKGEDVTGRGELES